jgi:hypothetical protein
MEGKMYEEQLKTAKIKVIKQSDLTSDCWLIQMFDGLNACDSCEARDTEDCGGGDTLARLIQERDAEKNLGKDSIGE